MNDIVKSLLTDVVYTKNRMKQLREDIGYYRDVELNLYLSISESLNSWEKCGIEILDFLRPMTSDDVKVGTFVFGRGYDEWYCHMVEEIMSPEDDWKAYCADDGCISGLHESYVLKD